MKKYVNYSVKERMEALNKLQSYNLQNVIIVSKYKGKVFEVIVDGVFKTNKEGLFVWDKSTGINITKLVAIVNNLYIDDKGLDASNLYQKIQKTKYNYGGGLQKSYYSGDVIVKIACRFIYEIKILLMSKSGILIDFPSLIMVDAKGNKISPLLKLDRTSEGLITFYVIN